jgi:predicted nucleic acid-binding protein
MNVFIDSNIWLSLYSFSSDDLNQFMKLKDLIGHDITIWLPEQVCNEVSRNRENKIKDTMNKFESWRFEIPNIVKGYPQYVEFSKIAANLKKAHKDLVSQIKQDIVEKALHADQAINEIFSLCNSIPMSNVIVNTAFIRYNIGNPPGKDNKYGDAINWLSLMQAVPDGEDLFFIGADGDFQSIIDKDRFNQFLLDEWQDSKKSSLFFFKSLTEFFNTHLKVIQLKNELIADTQKNNWISCLESSGNFANTHYVVSQLSKFSTWSDEQIKRIFDAVQENSQVGMISGDDDIADFLHSLESNQGKGDE